MRPMPISVVAVAILSGCGYHVVGSRASTLPKSIQTIAVPPFTSIADQYNLSDQFAEAISTEFSTRTAYRVVPSSAEPDAVLTGSIGSVGTAPTVSDPKTGRGTSIGLSVVLNITLTQRTTGKVLFSRQGMVVRDYYELAADPHQSYIASGPAFNRMSKTVARDVVASILDNF